jgi:TRAP-type C4-dicarboxylate transport system permease small subunit
LEKIADLYSRLLTVFMAVALMVMVALVFGNVVLRYVFNSGITISEEVSRWLFVWITFMGAVVAIKDNAHLGTDALVSRLSPAGKKACAVVGHLIMIYICWVMLLGSIAQTKINMGSAAPSTGLPVGIVYLAGVVFAVSAGLMLMRNVYRLLTGKISDEDLVMIQESEDTASLAGSHADPAVPKPR